MLPTLISPYTVLGNILQFLIFRQFWDICANTAGATFHTTVAKHPYQLYLSAKPKIALLEAIVSRT